MVLFCREFIYKTTVAVVSNALIVGGIGASFGYIYAKLSDLPAGQVARACAVWFAVQKVFLTLASSFIEDKTTRKIVMSAISAVSIVVALDQIRKGGLMTERTMMAIYAIGAALLLDVAFSLFFLKNKIFIE